MAAPSTHRPWSAGAATGLGRMPGTSVDEAARVIVGEVPELPYLPELPARGVGADPVGSAISLLTDITAEVVPSGWRISRRAGIDQRRANDQRDRLLDAAEQHFVGAAWIKLGVLGPWSLAAGLEVPSGNRSLTDSGAVDDIAASLTDGLLEHLSTLRSRTGADIVVQINEPDLARVLAGYLPTASGFGTVRAVDPIRVRETLATLVDALRAAGSPAVVRPGRTVPWSLLRESGFVGITVDLTALGTSSAALDPVGEAVEAGIVLLAGLITADADRIGLRARADPLLQVWRRWGFRLDQLPAAIVPTPVDGPAEITLEQATEALKFAQEIATALIDPPDDW